eukprot:scaffold8321_cov98-Phaeocystis_antarctica.AAC.1
MVEPAFGVLKQQIDEMLANGRAQMTRGSGAEWFERDSKSMTGSLFKMKEDAAVQNIGGFATSRQYHGWRSENGEPQLKISTAGNGSAASCAWWGSQELDDNVAAVLIGVMADGKA